METAPRTADDATGMRPRTGARSQEKQRRKPFDRRTRSAKRWLALRDQYLGQTGGRHVDLCGTLASLTVAQEGCNDAVARGEQVDPDVMLRLASEARRLSERLGILGEETGEDATAEAVAAARRHLGAAP